MPPRSWGPHPRILAGKPICHGEQSCPGTGWRVLDVIVLAVQDCRSWGVHMTDGKLADWLDLADALTALRSQLAEAQARAWDSAIHMAVEDVTIEFGLELQRSAKGNGEFR